jgi:hypothetical protein
MDIRHVEGIWMRNNPFRDAVRARNDKIISLEVEKLSGHGIKGQVPAVMLFKEWHPLKEARLDVPLLDGFGLAPRKVKERVNRGLGEDLSKDFQDLFSPPLAGQPIMDKGDFNVFHYMDYTKFLYEKIDLSFLRLSSGVVHKTLFKC